MGWWGTGLDLVGLSWTGMMEWRSNGLVDLWNMVSHASRSQVSEDVEVVPTFPGVVLPVRPSTFRVRKYLQQLDPSGYPSEAVSEPSGPSLAI